MASPEELADLQRVGASVRFKVDAMGGGLS
jgi:hypothetical protein